MSQSEKSTWNNLNKMLEENSIKFDDISNKTSSSLSDKNIKVFGQIIFDSGDLKSAVSQLLSIVLKCSSDEKVNTILVQETIREQFVNELKARLGKLPAQNSKLNNKVLLDLNAQFGGEIIACDNEKHYFTVGIPISHAQNTQHSVTAIEFFRTPKDVLQLIKSECKNISCYSLWTEKISLAYEIRNNLKAKIIVVNSIHFDDSSLPGDRYLKFICLRESLFLLFFLLAPIPEIMY